MKANWQGMAFMGCVLLSGCESLLPHSVTANEASYINQDCCDEENFQSGYYYNGYHENGWRYCIVKE